MPQRLKTEVRDRILQAAAHTFADRGYGAAKMADIARTAHIATSNIYKYYANKEALLDAVISPPMVAKFLRLLRSRIRHLEGAGNWPEDAAGHQGPARDMMAFWIENRLVICFLLQGAAGTRYAHIRDLVIRETARQAISYAKAQAGTEALAPHLEEIAPCYVADPRPNRGSMFRIYRDVRFSKDKTPYKTHFAGSFSRLGARLRGGYYLHLKPGGSFIATGFWAPNKEDLFRIRKELEMDASEFRKVINEKSFTSVWGKIQGDGVKTAPKGFDKEHPDIDLIKLKQFIFVRNFSDKEVLSNNFIHEVNKSFKAIRPYFDLMSDILTTNLNGESLLD